MGEKQAHNIRLVSRRANPPPVPCPAALPRTAFPRLDREIASKAQGTNMQITEDRKLAARLQVCTKLPAAQHGTSLYVVQLVLWTRALTQPDLVSLSGQPPAAINI